MIWKVAPLADWTEEQVWDYIREHDLPYNELHDLGYTSIGCAPCTRPTQAGEDPRAGRWWWETSEDRECGIHLPAPAPASQRVPVGAAREPRAGRRDPDRGCVRVPGVRRGPGPRGAGGRRRGRGQAQGGTLAELGAVVRRWTPAEAIEPALLDDALLAIVNTGDRVLDRQIAADARSRRVLVNTVDDIPACDWSAPAILRRGDLTIAVATGGIAPALAVRLRDRIAEEVRPAHGELLALFGELRPEIMATGRSFRDRRTLWYELVDGPALGLLEAGDTEGARQALRARSTPGWATDERLHPPGRGRAGRPGADHRQGRPPAGRGRCDRPRPIGPSPPLASARPDALLFDVGKEGHGTSVPQESTSEPLVRLARSGLRSCGSSRVTRSCSGGEARRCSRWRRLACPTRLCRGSRRGSRTRGGRHPGDAPGRGQERRVRDRGYRNGPARPNRMAECRAEDTIVVFMARHGATAAGQALLAAGRDQQTPAVITDATRPDQDVRLIDIGVLADGIGAPNGRPVLLVIGEVAAFAHEEAIPRALRLPEASFWA